MKKIYQPFIIEKANSIIEVIKNYGFFEDFQIKSNVYARQPLCDILTNRFIDGEYDESDDIVDIFPDVDLLMKFLTDVVLLENLNSLIKKGFIEYIEDENNEILYFPTEKGRKYNENTKKLK
jgi:hypothetical protein